MYSHLTDEELISVAENLAETDLEMELVYRLGRALDAMYEMYEIESEDDEL